MNAMNKIHIYHERNRNGELILTALIGERTLKRRYLYYTLQDAKKHFKNYLNEILP